MTLLAPSTLDPSFTAVVTAAYQPTLLAALEVARRTNARLLLNFSGPDVVDPDGFSLTKWKERVARYRSFDLSSYIADGTLMGHFILDEPNDRTNWNGDVVTPAELDEMARFSKELWPDLIAIVRAWPADLEGYQFRYLDAAWAQYHSRFGSIDDFVAGRVAQAKASRLALVGGLNVLAGGGRDGIPGYLGERLAMTASMVRTWGGAILDEPYFCAFFMYMYNKDYLARPDISAAMAELNRKAQSRPKQDCRRPD